MGYEIEHATLKSVKVAKDFSSADLKYKSNVSKETLLISLKAQNNDLVGIVKETVKGMLRIDNADDYAKAKGKDYFFEIFTYSTPAEIKDIKSSATQISVKSSVKGISVIQTLTSSEQTISRLSTQLKQYTGK